MNKFRLLSFLFAAFMLLTLASCGKDDDAEPSKRDLLTAQTWRGDKLYIDGVEATNNPYVIDYFIDIKGTTLKFEKDRTYTAIYTVGDEKETESGTWDLKNNDQQIAFAFLSQDTDIKRLTKDNLDIAATFEEDGEKITIEMRFIK
ncbi:hypothetical protein [Pontibacter ruber]|uniref:Lipocalin-like domain-containing protein n=1 Tax=Pontibacter ruber TaxID=1343895 RepID=A0ABW5CSB0_9BACT|nr:hypothetical protein [Pontibacter ruber]